MSNEVLLTGNDISPVRVHVDTGDLCNVQIMYNAFKYQARLYMHRSTSFSLYT